MKSIIPSRYISFLFIPRNLSLFKFSGVVSRLFKQCSPTAVAFYVISIVVNSINCSFFFSKFFNVTIVTNKHIFLEFFKRFPSIFDSPTSISRILLTFGIFTARFKSHKDIVKSLMSSTCESVSDRIFPKLMFIAHTTTRGGASTSQITANSNVLFSTRTNTKKSKISPFIFSMWANDSQLSKSLSCEVNFIHKAILA